VVVLQPEAESGRAVIAVRIDKGAVSVVRRPKPAPPEGHALLRLVCGGICNTDLELVRGYYGFRGTPGHEFVAVVEECAEAKWVGRRVVGEINLACGRCEWCRRGLGRHCPSRTVLGIVKHPGAFSEYFTLPVANLRAVPAQVPTEHAVFAEPIAAACEILEQVRIPKGAHVAVLGDGKLGLLIAQVLQCHGAQVHLYGRHREKMAVAEALGVEGRLAGKLPAAAYEFTVEATGSAEGLRQAVRLTRPRGTVVMKSTVHGEVGMDSAAVIVPEITLVGSRCGRFEPALKLLATGRLRLSEMISASIQLAEAPAAFDAAAKKGVLKVLLNA
jgi:alcohol dehydrogenase